MVKIRNILSSHWIFYLVSITVYSVITLCIFYHRLPHITTEFGMPDVDTDGGLWYQWFLYYTKAHGLLPQITTLSVYPFGYDLTFLPFSNLIYSTQVFFLEHFLGFSWSNLILITNISSLITYPLSAMGGLFLCFYITKNKWSSFMTGCIFAFSSYHILMGRGQMSINHIEFIPFFLLSVLYFLDKKNILSFLISAVLFSLTFMADPYYAFFSGIYSVLIYALYNNREGIFNRVKSSVIYYGGLFIVLILTNISFIYSSFYLFDKTQLAQSGRNSIPRNELVNILYYFSKDVIDGMDFLYQQIGGISHFVEIILFAVAILGLILVRPKRNYILFCICFLLTIVLSSYIPSLYFINILYFRYFGMFRGVSRMILPSALFLGLLIGMVIQHAGRRYVEFKKSKKYLYLIAYIFLICVVLSSGINTDLTWKRNTDFSKLAELYEPIRKNDSIKVVATYPMIQNKAIEGCPQGYQILGQIIHNKSFACGASPFSKGAIDYYTSISDITNKNTIGILSKYGVDTIFISNDLIKNAEEINYQLKKDPRLQFIGHYSQPHDTGYVSSNDLSRNINVYQIQAVVEKNKNPQPLFGTNTNSKLIGYKKIDPYRYVLHLQSTGDVFVTFDSPYSTKWLLLPGDLSEKSDLLFFNASSPYSHIRHNDYANAWKIILAKDTPQDIYVTLYFAPRFLDYLSDKIRIITFAISIMTILILGLKNLFPALNPNNRKNDS